MNDLKFTFSDTIAGYVTRFDKKADSFDLKTSDGREFRIELTRTPNRAASVAGLAIAEQ